MKGFVLSGWAFGNVYFLPGGYLGKLFQLSRNQVQKLICRPIKLGDFTYSAYFSERRFVGP